MKPWQKLFVIASVGCCGIPFAAIAQIDPYRRDLVQLGYNAALQGHAPFAGYAFYYHNQPGFIRTNLTLRLALAPTYVDSELGISKALGENTDFAVGVAGGGFADSYSEVREGKYHTRESFIGHGGELSANVYHLFNPGARIPLNGVFRTSGRFSAFDDDSNTDENFELPDNRGTLNVRTGLRWGGREPILYPSLAMELSVWYEGEFRTEADNYGYGDREVERHTHAFYAAAALAYELPEIKHVFNVELSAGTSLNADRFSAYRLGALLPFASEFPLSIPGYYYQEISADQFVLLKGNYLVPLADDCRWNLDFNAACAVVDYLPGLAQSGNWHSGVGAGIFYRSTSWRVAVGYGYGIDAIRSDERGGHSIGFLLQLDWAKAVDSFHTPISPGRWRGWNRVMNVFAN